MQNIKYSKEFKINKIKELRKARARGDIKDWGMYYSESLKTMIRRWEREERINKPKFYTKYCECCGGEFRTTNHERKYCCDDCRNIAFSANKKNTANMATCFDCVNWWACREMNNPKLADKKCSEVVRKRELTKSQLKLKLRAIGGKPVFFKKVKVGGKVD